MLQQIWAQQNAVLFRTPLCPHPLCNERLLRWSWYEDPQEPVYYWYCLECDKAGRTPFIFCRPKEDF